MGKCPKCDGENLEYEALTVGGGDDIFYPFSCPDCGFKGKEWYSLAFDCYTDMDGNVVKD